MMSDYLTAWADWIAQHLTGAPLWLQAPIVIFGSLILCSILAVILLRVIDFLSVKVFRSSGPARTPRPKKLTRSQRPGEELLERGPVRIVISEDPR